MSLVGQTRTSSLEVAWPLPPSADIGREGSPLVKRRNCLAALAGLLRAASQHGDDEQMFGAESQVPHREQCY
jgi:hypothetical protein